MSYIFGFLIESMVAVLLLLTILYVVKLSKQLRVLKADEQSLRATISELVTATQIAERAIASLKMTMRDGESKLTSQLADADKLAQDLATQLTAGDELVNRLARITGAARAADSNAPDARKVAAAAQAFVERTSSRGPGKPSNLAA
ncbi:MAG: chemotaxis protein [Pseudolabrys sp.]|nr:chemotaxis protein [Pseudolabrys sp.]